MLYQVVGIGAEPIVVQFARYFRWTHYDANERRQLSVLWYYLNEFHSAEEAQEIKVTCQ